MEKYFEENALLKENLKKVEEKKRILKSSVNQYSLLYQCEKKSSEALEIQLNETRDELEKHDPSKLLSLQQENDRLNFANELIFQENENLRRELDQKEFATSQLVQEYDLKIQELKNLVAKLTNKNTLLELEFQGAKEYITLLEKCTSDENESNN